MPPSPRLVQARAVHDDAMLSRLTAVLAVHPVGSFSYTLDGESALVRLEVLGDAAQETRVLAKLRRIVGVLEAAQAPPAG